jgi:hypothetical protein
MTATEIAHDSEAPRAEGSARRSHLAVWISVAAVVVSVAGGVLLAVRERASAPDIFYSAPSSVSTWSDHTPVGSHFTFGMTYVRKHVNDPATLLSATPVVAENSANATFVVSVCSPDLSRNGAIGSTFGDLHRYCTRVVPAAGATLALVTSGQTPVTTPDQVVLTITARQPGTVVVKGLDLTYIQDGRTAHQTVGEFIRLREQ